MSKKAFTLIELMVVVAIIGILLTLLLPSLLKARDAALSAACLSNQKQIYIGFQRYTQENNNKVPFNEFSDGNGQCPSWEPQVSQYMGVDYPDWYFGTKTWDEFKAANGNKYKDSKAIATLDNPVLRCPADTVKTSKDGFERSYQMNGLNNYWSKQYNKNSNPYKTYGVIRTKDQRFLQQFDLNPILLIEDTMKDYDVNKRQGNSWNAVLASTGDFDKLTTPHFRLKFNVLLLDGSSTSKNKNLMRVNDYEAFQSFNDQGQLFTL